MKYIIYTLSDGIESRPISNQKQEFVSFKKGIPPFPTLKDERFFVSSAEVYILLLSHMTVNKC